MTLAQRLSLAIRGLFAERQIYIRSKGTVTFVPLSSRSLVLLWLFVLALSAWLGFTSVNLIFKNDLAAQREREYREMQLAYESELSRLRLAYDDLNAQLVLTRDWFGETTHKLEKRHNELSKVLEQHASISTELRDMQKSFARIAARNKRGKSRTELVGRYDTTFPLGLESRATETLEQKSTIALTDLSDKTGEVQNTNVAMPHLPEDINRRVVALDTRQKDLLDALEENIDLKIGEFERLISDTEILEPDSFMARVLPDSDTAIGGPFIPMNSRVGLNNKLQQQLYRISNGLDRLSGLSQSMAKIPLALPIHDYRLTSTFGARMDPFKKRISFHAGVDFGTANGTPVYATLPGTVVRSGYKGPYGLMVEIDHDNGFRTRYGHLARSRVRNGQRVDFQQHIADAGNSGRSTGPHLHYEVWYDGKVRDPMALLDAGKEIFNVAETIAVQD
jgi:murein DD-endopeptidase MepM/ murein hydrolase activator NlpD